MNNDLDSIAEIAFWGVSDIAARYRDQLREALAEVRRLKCANSSLELRAGIAERDLAKAKGATCPEWDHCTKGHTSQRPRREGAG